MKHFARSASGDGNEARPRLSRLFDGSDTASQLTMASTEPEVFDGLIDGSMRQSFPRLMDHVPGFRENHTHYYAVDEHFGHVHVTLRQDDDSTIHAFVMSRIGQKAISPMGTKAQARYSAAIGMLPQNLRDRPECGALAVVLAYYLSHRSPRHERSPEHLCVEQAADLVRGMCMYRRQRHVTAKLFEYFESRATRYASMAVIRHGDANMPTSLVATRLMRELGIAVPGVESSRPRAEDDAKSAKKGHGRSLSKGSTSQGSAEYIHGVIEELIVTEANYVRKLSHLIHDYFEPLRKNVALGKGSFICAYELNSLFPSAILDIYALNQDFINALEACVADDKVLEVAYQFFLKFKEPYALYLEQSLMFEQLLRSSYRNRKLKKFCDQQKQRSELHVSLRELVMEPVQRIPRYSLLLENIKTHLATSSTMLPVCKEALSVVREIGQMRHTDSDARMSLFYTLTSAVAGFPPELVSSSRFLITALDVQETISEIGCLTLVLFNDFLCFLRRRKDGSFAPALLRTAEPTSERTQISRSAVFEELHDIADVEAFQSDNGDALWLHSQSGSILGQGCVRLLLDSSTANQFCEAFWRTKAARVFPDAIVTSTNVEPRTYFIAQTTFERGLEAFSKTPQFVILIDPPDSNVFVQLVSAFATTVFLVCNQLDNGTMSVTVENSRMAQPKQCFVSAENVASSLHSEILKALSTIMSPGSAFNAARSARWNEQMLHLLKTTDGRLRMASSTSPVKRLSSLLPSPSPTRRGDMRSPSPAPTLTIECNAPGISRVDFTLERKTDKTLTCLRTYLSSFADLETIDWSKSKSDSLASQELCYTISKHPDREYALAGSPPHVVLGSFIQFCNKIVLKTCKFGLGTDGLEPEIRASVPHLSSAQESKLRMWLQLMPTDRAQLLQLTCECIRVAGSKVSASTRDAYYAECFDALGLSTHTDINVMRCLISKPGLVSPRSASSSGSDGDSLPDPSTMPPPSMPRSYSVQDLNKVLPLPSMLATALAKPLVPEKAAGRVARGQLGLSGITPTLDIAPSSGARGLYEDFALETDLIYEAVNKHLGNLVSDPTARTTLEDLLMEQKRLRKEIAALKYKG